MWEWRQILEACDFRLCRSKIEYMGCNFSKKRSISSLEMKVGDHTTTQVTRFKYLGSIVLNNREIVDVNHWIHVRWLKWRRTKWFMWYKNTAQDEGKILSYSCKTGNFVWDIVLGGKEPTQDKRRRDEEVVLNVW